VRLDSQQYIGLIQRVGILRDEHYENGDSGPAQEDGAREAALAISGGDVCAELEKTDGVRPGQPFWA
jgi:hypothetical protein